MLKKTNVEVFIQYNDLAFVETREEPKMNAKELFAFVGGHLHFLLGMSLMSFVQIIEIFLLSVLKVNLSEVIDKVHRQEQATKQNSKKDYIYMNSLCRIKMDCIPDAVRASHKCLSLFWLVLFLSSACACVYLIYDTVLMFNEHRVTTTVAHSDDLAIAIRFCSAMPLQSEFSSKLMKEYLKGYFPNPHTLSFWNIQSAIQKGKINMSSLLNLTEAQLAQLIVTDVSNMVVGCSINGKECKFEFYFDSDYIGCYRLLTQTEIGNSFL